LFQLLTILAKASKSNYSKSIDHSLQNLANLPSNRLNECDGYHTMAKSLRILAGSEAFRTIKRDGLDKEAVKIVPGAAGGPKWLVLGRMDRVIFGEWFKDRQTPVDILGASSGAWRFAAAAQADPAKAEARLEETYITSRFDLSGTSRGIKEQCAKMVHAILGETGIEEILANSKVRLHLMTARSTAFTSGEGKFSLGAPSAIAFAANGFSRNLLDHFFTRALFSDPRSKRSFNWSDNLSSEAYFLSPSNLADALLASGAIPVVTEGVTNIEGAAPGVYRDGGVTDYQFASPLLGDNENGIVLYPHYAPTVTPGWLDKHLPWRRAKPDRLAKTVILTPSPEFISTLPGSKIPIRQDFVNMKDHERISLWRQAADQAEQLADELREIIEKDSWNDVVEPLS